MKFKIYAGLGGGFGGARFERVAEYSNVEEAEMEAWERACEIYESYGGMHGLRDVSSIMEEEEVDEKIAEEIYCEERENWLDYYVKPVVEGEEEDEE